MADEKGYITRVGECVDGKKAEQNKVDAEFGKNHPAFAKAESFLEGMSTPIVINLGQAASCSVSELVSPSASPKTPAGPAVKGK